VTRVTGVVALVGAIVSQLADELTVMGTDGLVLVTWMATGDGEDTSKSSDNRSDTTVGPVWTFSVIVAK
jgi:hypothetical protein